MSESTAKLANLPIVRRSCYHEGMPRPLTSDVARALANDRARASIQRARDAKRAEVAGMRDVTSSVQNAPALPGDRTNNGADKRKSRKLTDKLESHTADVAYVVSDTTILQNERIVEVRRSPSRLIVRDENGSSSVDDTLALVSRWRLYRASNRKGQ